MDVQGQVVTTSSRLLQFPLEHEFSWFDICEIIARNQVHLLSRNSLQLQVYDRWINLCRLEYNDIEDYILHVVFGWAVYQEEKKEENDLKLDTNCSDNTPSDIAIITTTITTETTAGRKKRAVKIDSTTCNKLQIILRQNDFPYSLPSNIVHYCLWSNQGLTDKQINEYLTISFSDAQLLNQSDTLKQNSFTKQVIWFMNPPHCKSIQTIWHIHVFLLVK
jgi:hypothetical protein